MCKGNVSLRCEKSFIILLGAVGPVEAEKMAFKVSWAIFLCFPHVISLPVGPVWTSFVKKMLA